MQSTRRRLLGVAAGTLTLAGCTGSGGDGGGGGGEQPTTEPGTPSPSPSATPRTAREEYSLYNWERLDRADAADADRITMKNTEFHPLVARVSSGPLEFVNEDMGRHTVTIPAIGVDKSVGGGERVTVEFDRTGAFDYVCTLHAPDMLGRVIVTG